MLGRGRASAPTRWWKSAGTSRPTAARTISVDADAGGRPVEPLDRVLEPAGQQARPEDQQQVADDAAGERRLDHVSSPRKRANRAMISSAALPKVAFSSPPIPGPSRSASCSVASPISPASGMIARRRQANCDDRRRARAAQATTATGTKTSRSRIQPDPPRVDPVAPAAAAAAPARRPAR